MIICYLKFLCYFSSSIINYEVKFYVQWSHLHPQLVHCERHNKSQVKSGANLFTLTLAHFYLSTFIMAERVFMFYYVENRGPVQDNRGMLTELYWYKHLFCGLSIFTPDQFWGLTTLSWRRQWSRFSFHFWLKKTRKCSITVMFGMNNDILIALIFLWAVIF